MRMTRIMFKLVKKVILVILLFVAMPALAYYNPGTPTGFVNDYANVISDNDQQALETKILNFEKESKEIQEIDLRRWGSRRTSISVAISMADIREVPAWWTRRHMLVVIR